MSKIFNIIFYFAIKINNTSSEQLRCSKIIFFEIQSLISLKRSGDYKKNYKNLFIKSFLIRTNTKREITESKFSFNLPIKRFKKS